MSDQYAVPDFDTPRYSTDVRELFPDSRLEYPFEREWAVFTSHSGKRRPHGAFVFCGVYLISTDLYPEYVKIGRSKDMYKRSFEWDHTKSPFFGNRRVNYIPLAFIHTAIHGEVERYLHLRFKEFRHRGNEWFRSEPVQAWLNSL